MDTTIQPESTAWVQNETGAKSNKFEKRRQKQISKAKVAHGGKAALSGVAADDIPHILVNSPEVTPSDSQQRDSDENNDVIRVNSARRSKKLDTTHLLASDDLNDEHTDSATAFNKELSLLVKELTNKVLIDQPSNINEYLAEYLEDRVKMEKRKKKKARKKLQRRLSKSSSPQRVMHGVEDQRSITDVHETSAPAGTTPGKPKHSVINYSVPNVLPITTISGSKDVITQCEFFMSYIIFSSLDTKIRIYDRDADKLKLEIPNHKPVTRFCLIPIDNKKILLLIGTTDGQVPGWRIKFGSKCQAKFNVIIPMHQPNPIRCMTTSPKGKYLATGCCFEMTQISLWGELGKDVRGTLKLWDLDSIINYVDHPQQYYDDLQHKALKTYKQIVSQANKSIKRAVSSYAKLSGTGDKEHFYGIGAIAFSPDDSKILVGFCHPDQKHIRDMKMLAVLQADTLETLWLQYAHFYQITDILSLPALEGYTATFLVATEFNLNICKVQSKENVSKTKVSFPWRIDFDSGEHHCGCISPCGKLVASACGARLFVMRISDGTQIACYDAHILDIKYVRFSEDGKFIATAAADNTIKLWHAPQESISRGGLLVSLTEGQQHAVHDEHSPRRRELHGDGEPISLAPDLYSTNLLSPTGANSQANFSHVNDESPRRLSRQETHYDDLSPGATAVRGRRAESPRRNAFEHTLSHLHANKGQSPRSRSPSTVHRLGEELTSTA